jgi:hypothetical protein
MEIGAKWRFPGRSPMKMEERIHAGLASAFMFQYVAQCAY